MFLSIEADFHQPTNVWKITDSGFITSIKMRNISLIDAVIEYNKREIEIYKLLAEYAVWHMDKIGAKSKKYVIQYQDENLVYRLFNNKLLIPDYNIVSQKRDEYLDKLLLLK